MLGRLLPRRSEFFVLFSRQAELDVQGAKLLGAMVRDLARAEEHAARVHDVEHEADRVCQQAMETLHRSFITPIDRGDVHAIASALDDILDNIEATAMCLSLYRIGVATPELLEMCGHLVAATEALKAAVDSLQAGMDAPRARSLCAVVKAAERDNDRLLRRATARLFHDERDARTLIMWKEIYANIEDAIDRCEDVANLVEGVVLENS